MSDFPFWPTCRSNGLPQLLPSIENCQRCGEAIGPNTGWWCQDCAAVISWLQESRGMSMVQIAASGECEPVWASREILPPGMSRTERVSFVTRKDDPSAAGPKNVGTYRRKSRRGAAA